MKACPRERKDFPGRLAQITKQELTDKGFLTTATEVFEGVQAVVINYEGEDCTSVFAQYVTTRNHTGFNHSEAVASLRYLMVQMHALMKK